MEKAMSLSTQNLPDLTKPKPERRFVLSRIDLPELFLTDNERKFLVNQLNEGSRFVHIGEQTIAASSITGIAPRMTLEQSQDTIASRDKVLEMTNRFLKEQA